MDGCGGVHSSEGMMHTEGPLLLRHKKLLFEQFLKTSLGSITGQLQVGPMLYTLELARNVL